MGVWRKIMEAISHFDATGSMYAGLIGAPLAFDPLHDTRPRENPAERPQASQAPGNSQPARAR
jgi:hypothetical protein